MIYEIRILLFAILLFGFYPIDSSISYPYTQTTDALCKYTDIENFQQRAKLEVQQFLDTNKQESVEFRLALLEVWLGSFPCIKEIYVDTGWVKTNPPQKEFFLKVDNGVQKFEIIMDISVDEDIGKMEVHGFHR